MSAQVAADLRAAADVLERDGWKQGSYHGWNGCHCAVGAIAVAVSGAKHPDPDAWVSAGWRATRLRAAMRQVESKVKSHHLPTWNDARDRTADQVIAALRAAAHKADQP